MPETAEVSEALRQLRLWSERLTLPNFVYVIQGDSNPAIKVGRAADVPGRIAELQTGNPERLRLLRVVPGDHVLEWNLHRRLAADRGIGEWFDGPLVPGFLKYMSDLAWCMVHAYDGSGLAPSYTDFDSFVIRPPRPRAERRAPAPATVTVEPEQDAEPVAEEIAPETQELWSRVAVMWMGGSTRKEIRGAEGLSEPRLARVIKEMRANGYELADVYRTRPDPGPLAPRLGSHDPHRRRHPWRPSVG